MIDLLSLVYGALVTLGAIALLKVIDIVLEKAINKTVFSKIWTLTSKSFKKFMTRLKPIRICFQFAVRTKLDEPSRVRENINLLVDSLSRKYQEYVKATPISWNDDNNLGSVRLSYNEREFRMDIQIRTEYRDIDPEEEIFNSSINKASTISEGIAFSVETDFPFHLLDQMLLSLSALMVFIKEELKETIPVMEFSKGMFTLAPIKGDFTIDDWIKKKQFDVSLLLKAQENILVNLYPKRAEIIFPSLQIDDKVSEYLRETILNYYL
jgi:hypothetical protein